LHSGESPSFCRQDAKTMASRKPTLDRAIMADGKQPEDRSIPCPADRGMSRPAEPVR
jgi:hypothetical protein